MTRLALVGASGHGRVIADCAEMTGWGEVVFYDDNPNAVSERFKFEIAGTFGQLLDDLGRYNGVIVAIGDNNTRYQLVSRLIKVGAPMATIVHPTAAVSQYARIGDGSVILANAVVNAGAAIGSAGIVNSCAVVEHDCLLEDAVHISPGAALAGNVQVGTGSWIGMGASVIPGVHIADWVTVGAGAVVLDSVQSGQTVAGVPARPIKVSRHENAASGTIL